MIINGHNHSDLSDKLQKCQDYLQGLEEERRKIQVFQRELPLCLHLVTQAIETCKQQLSGPTSEYNLNGGQSECSEQTSSDVPVFEEFIPLKRASSHDSDDVDGQENSKKLKNVSSDKSSKKSDWLRSTQLWNQTPDPEPSKESISPRKVAVKEVKRNSSGGAFHPFKKDKNVGNGDAPPLGPTVPPPSTSSTAETGCSSGTKEDKDSLRKARRCWSPELHRRFLQALQQLGGAHVATPKQIRELMKVDGLTNDEVKSHLQKYRLHTRRPSPSNQNNSGNNAQAPQFVVVGGIWVPPEYAATISAAPGGTANVHDIYAPIATMPPPIQRESASPRERQSNSDERGGHSEGRVQSHSSATSSSTHTTTASLAY